MPTTRLDWGMHSFATWGTMNELMALLEATYVMCWKQSMSYLHPGAWGGTEINADITLLQKLPLSVELDKLEASS